MLWREFVCNVWLALFFFALLGLVITLENLSAG
jgi:hypothetical protein